MSPRLVEIENRTEALEELYEKYEEINDELVELIEEQDYNFKLFTKVKNVLRVVNNSISSRKKRINSMENPEAKDGEEITPAPEKAIIPHRERLAEYEEEKAELEEKANEYLSKTRDYTAQALRLRKERNALYDQYTKYRLELKDLK